MFAFLEDSEMMENYFSHEQLLLQLEQTLHGSLPGLSKSILNLVFL